MIIGMVEILMRQISYDKVMYFSRQLESGTNTTYSQNGIQNNTLQLKPYITASDDQQIMQNRQWGLRH